MKTTPSDRITGRPAMMVALVVATLLSLACHHRFYSPTEPDGVDSSSAVAGSGSVVEESRSIGAVTEVILAGIGTVHIDHGVSDSLVVRAEDNLLPHLRTEVAGQLLRIDTEPGVNLRPTRPIEYLITLSSLSRVELSGAGDIYGSGLTMDRLTLRTTGAGDLRFTEIQARELDVTLAGAGEIVASGSSDHERITLTGAGGYQGGDLQCETAEVAIRGVGSATVRVRDRLVADISGIGSVYYIGSPTVESTISGSGDVVQIGG